jgi:PAS domain S-box-containing protein
MSDQITSNVLVVDDDCVSLHLVSSILAPHYDVHTADCARIAIQNIQYHRYDIIILDVEMPDTNGFQLCKLIRATNLNGGAPIIFISSSDKPEDKVAGFRSGCDDYITKPFISDEIICRIKNHVEHYHLKTALETKVSERTVALSDEIERRRVAEIQYKKLFTAITQSPLSIMIVGTNGLIEYVNPQFTRTTGYTPDESIGRNPRFLKSGYTLPEEYDVMWGCITSGNIWTGVFCTLCKDLSELWENVTIAPVADDNNIITHYIAIKENITKQKKIENEFLATKEIAKSAERAKESFIQMISHELRTPLNSIIGFADLISMEPYGPLGDPRYQEYSKRISESGRRHLEMIKQLIDLSLLSAGRYTVSDDLFAIEEAINFALKSALQNDKSICHNIT